jgi:hypothetical protein
VKRFQPRQPSSATSSRYPKALGDAIVSTSAHPLIEQTTQRYFRQQLAELRTPLAYCAHQAKDVRGKAPQLLLNDDSKATEPGRLWGKVGNKRKR